MEFSFGVVGVILALVLAFLPLGWLFRLLAKSSIGFLVLALSQSFLGFGLGVNLWNALIIGLLGLPGFALLLLLQWYLPLGL